MKNLIEKLENNDFNLDWSEIQIVYSNAKVARIFTQKINDDYTLWNYKFDDFFNSAIFYELKPLPEKFLDNVAIWHVENNYFNPCFFGLISSDEYVTSDFWNYFDNKLSDPTYTFDTNSIISMNEKLINLLLKNKRYSTLSKIEIFKNIRKDTLDKLMEEYPFDEYPIPIFYETYLKENYSYITYEEKIKGIYKNKNKMSFATLLLLIDNKVIPNEEIINAITSKFDDNYSIMDLPTKYDLNNFISMLTDKQKNTLYYAAIDKKCVSLFLSIDDDFSNNNFIINVIAQLILDGSEVPDKIMNKNLLENDTIVSALVNKGYINQASHSTLFNEYIPKVIKLINESNTNYINYNRYYDYKKYKEITNAFVINNELHNISDVTSMEEFSIIFKKKLLTDENYSKTINTLPKKLSNDVDLIVYLLNKEYYENFFFVFNKNHSNFDILNDNSEIFKKHITSSIGFATKLLQTNIKEIIMCEKLLSTYIKLGEPYFSQIISYIEMHDGLFNCYTEELFEDIKYYACQKYNLNVEHLNTLENEYGPSIVAYINSSNIHKIINLTDEEFNNFLGLFPKDILDIKNLEAEIYDAFKQLEFTIEEKDIVAMFANINHSLSDKDGKYREYIYELKEYLNDDKLKIIYKGLKTKYPILEQSKEEVFSYILENINIGENREQVLSLVHELCNYYVKFKREDYRHTDKYDFAKDLNLSKVPDSHEYNVKLIKSILSTGVIENKNFVQIIIAEEKEYDRFNMDTTLLLDCINYYLGNNDYEFINDIRLIKMNIKSMLQIVEYYIDKYNSQLDIRKYQDNILNSGIKTHSYLSENKKELIYLCNQLGIDISQLGNLELFIKSINTMNMKDLFKFIMNIDSQNINQALANYMENNNIDNINKLPNEFKRILENYRYYNIYTIFSSMDIDLITNTILSNETSNKLNNRLFINNSNHVYESLKKIISKYKLYLLPIEFNNLLHKDCFNLSCSINDISSFISYYYKIYEIELGKAINKTIKLEKNKMGNQKIDMEKIVDKTIKKFTLSIVDIFKYADIYSATSSVYSIILGPKDAMYIKTNPKPLPAKHKIKNDGRLKEAVQRTIQNFKRLKVTIPTFNSVYEVNGKQIRAIVGNFTAPYNLTHGERTEACMRIGGEGETLFDFCLDNINGFHITFESLGYEYISRVSGFRNGNTVFLNELRESCINDKYSNKDVVDIAKIVSQQLIELSKNSQCPIDNVVISRSYATENIDDKDVMLNITDVKEGIGAFYSDVNQKCIVLATTSNDKDYVDVNLDKSNIPEYVVARESIKMGNNEDIVSQINRIHALRMIMYDNVSYEYVTSTVTEVKTAIVGGDWYIYIDKENKIHEEIIDIHPNARKEMEQVKQQFFITLAMKKQEEKLCV